MCSAVCGSRVGSSCSRRRGPRRLDRAAVEAAVFGGAVLGGGGGGSMAAGLALGLLAVEKGPPELVDPADLPDDGLLVTVSMVGSPSGSAPYPAPDHFVRALELLTSGPGAQDPGAVAGLVTNECGGTATVNGWLQAAVLGLPVVDAPANGRAHPTAAMGSMGLHRKPGWLSRQAAVGGDRADATYLELVVEGSLEHAGGLVRQASTRIGGLVAVARNPVTVAYARENAAVGAIGQAMALGRAMLDHRDAGPRAVIEAARVFLGGKVVAEGRVARVKLDRKEGFDLGAVTVEPSSSGRALDLLFWNEYAVCERAGARLATFPDLIATFDLSTGLPVTTAEIAVGSEVAVLLVDRRRLILGAGMRDPELMRPLEAAVGREMVSHVF